MYLLCIVLFVIVSVLMCGIVLIQNSKGGGLASSFASSNQIMGVRKTTDIIEKITWGLAVGIIVLSILSVYFIPTATVEGSAMMKAATEQQATNANNLPGFGASQTPQTAPAAPQATETPAATEQAQ